MKVVDINGKLKEKSKKEFVAYFKDFVSELPYDMKIEIAKLAKDDFEKYHENVLNFYLQFKTGLVMEAVH